MYGTLSAKSSGELVCVCTGGASVITPLATSTYNRKKSNFPIDPSAQIDDNIYMKIVCAVCGEETAGNPTYSFYGSAHKWGPTNHTFEPKIVEEEQ